MQPRRYLLKSLAFATPFLFLLVVYFCIDPFKVLYHYDCYYDSNNPFEGSMNKGFITLQNWINRSPEHTYNSYIFGSSRSMAYRVSIWDKYIREDAQSCYHMDAYRESLFAIERKFHFLQDRKVPLKNALIVLDSDIISRTVGEQGFLFGMDYRLCGKNFWTFECTYAAAFFKEGYLGRFISLSLLGLVNEHVGGMAGITSFNYDPVINEMRETYTDSLIEADSTAYYRPKRDIFYERDPKTGERIIGKDQLWLFRSILRVLKTEGTNYKVVISPCYNQVKFNPEDLKVLKDLFGEKNVYDFSGVNHFTADVHNFYEIDHYRPPIATAVMDSIYKN